MTLMGKPIDFWLVLGFAGQFIFFMRFIVQWIVSERRKMSVIPISFWYFSLGGAAVTLIYSIHRQDPVFIFAQTASLFIYTRNLAIIKKSKEIQTPQD